MSLADNPPGGRLDMITAGNHKITVQTEFVTEPVWKIETRVYVGGAVKKIVVDEVDPDDVGDIVARIGAIHEKTRDELVAKLEKKSGS